MSKNHGRRIIDTVRNEDLREKTRSALYDIIAEFIRQAPMEALDMGLLLEAKKPGKDCRGARAKERRG